MQEFFLFGFARNSYALPPPPSSLLVCPFPIPNHFESIGMMVCPIFNWFCLLCIFYFVLACLFACLFVRLSVCLLWLSSLLSFKLILISFVTHMSAIYCSLSQYKQNQRMRKSKQQIVYSN